MGDILQALVTPISNVYGKLKADVAAPVAATVPPGTFTGGLKFKKEGGGYTCTGARRHRRRKSKKTRRTKRRRT